MTRFEYNLSEKKLKVIHTKEDDFHTVLTFNTEQDESLNVDDIDLVWTISDGQTLLVTISGSDIVFNGSEAEIKKAASFFAEMPLIKNYSHRLYDDATNNTFASGLFRLETSGVTPGTKKTWYYGAAAASVTNSAGVKALPGSVNQVSPVFVLQTGTVNKKFIIALPVGTSLISVTDQTALGFDITSQYVLVGQIAVTDSAGVSSDYNIYEMNNAIPYSTSHNHYITTG